MGEQRDDRRRFLAKAGVAGAAAWVAPLVLSQPAQAATSQPTPPPQPCVSCNSANVVNPNFDDGLTGWTTVGTVLAGTYFSAGAVGPPAAEPNLAAVGPAEPVVGRLSQDVPIDGACRGLPFTLSFLFFGFAPGQLYVNSVQFTNASGDVGAPFTVSIPGRLPDVDTGEAFMAPTMITGIVPDTATGATIAFPGTASDISGALVDVVDFTICSN
jgi:hypothetical protein